MRLILAVFLVAGCSDPVATGAYGHHVEIDAPDEAADSGPIAWQSQYAAALAGVYFPPALEWAVAGMDGNTCRLQYAMGAVEADEDLGEGEDTVWDGTPNDHGTDTVVVFDGSDTLTFAEFPSGQVLWSLPAPGAAAARFYDGGVAVLSEADGCRLDWRSDSGPQTAEVEASCDDGAALEVEPDGSRAWVLADGALWSVAPRGEPVQVAATVDHMARDGVTGALYVASAATVRALGASSWEADVGGTVMGIQDLGPANAAIVSVHASDGDWLIALDGATGHPLVQVALRRTAAGIVAADDGRAIAMIGDWRTDFFAVGDLDPRP